MGNPVGREKTLDKDDFEWTKYICPFVASDGRKFFLPLSAKWEDMIGDIANHLKVAVENLRLEVMVGKEKEIFEITPQSWPAALKLPMVNIITPPHHHIDVIIDKSAFQVSHVIHTEVPVDEMDDEYLADLVTSPATASDRPGGESPDMQDGNAPTRFRHPPETNSPEPMIKRTRLSGRAILSPSPGSLEEPTCRLNLPSKTLKPTTTTTSLQTLQPNDSQRRLSTSPSLEPIKYDTSKPKKPRRISTDTPGEEVPRSSRSDTGRIRIYVNGDCTDFNIIVKPNILVTDLKKLIRRVSSKKKIPNHFDLVFEGNILRDEERLRKYHIDNLDTIELVARQEQKVGFSGEAENGYRVL